MEEIFLALISEGVLKRILYYKINFLLSRKFR